jgi:hypothetical protein
MSADETRQVFETAEKLFAGVVKSYKEVVEKIIGYSEGYPYFAQLLGKACVDKANQIGTNDIAAPIFDEVLN